MASDHNPSNRGRRLSELLEEQQEPFLLADYLLENGYSFRTINSHSQPSIMCWPGGNACRMLQRVSSIGFKRKGGGFLRSVLTKLFYGKSIVKALNWESKSIENGRLSASDCSSEMRSNTHEAESGRSSDSGLGAIELDGRDQWRSMLSPVSVLELHSHCGSPCHNHRKEEDPSDSSLDSAPSTEDSDIFEELIESATSPHCCKTKRELGQLDQLLFDCVREVEERILGSNVSCLGSEKASRIIQDQIFSWERQRGDVNSIDQLIGSDLSMSMKDWSHFKPQLEEIGIEIEAAIFEEIREETILEMIGSYCK